MISKLPPISCLNCDLSLNIIILVKHKNGTQTNVMQEKVKKKESLILNRILVRLLHIHVLHLYLMGI